MLSFSEVEAPIADVDELLVAMHEDGSALSPSALLLMGAVGNRVRESDPERFDEIRGYVEEKIFEGSSREEQLTALEALGNLGPEATPEYVEQLIHSDDVDLRGTAVRTLRDTFDERSDWLLANTVREDPSDEVRVAAVEILAENGQRGERGAAHELLDEALRTDASEDVRKSALAGMNVVATPESRESIAWVAANDTSEELRAMATAMVESWERTGEATEDGTATE
jgi:hypothetical protein